MTVFVEANCFAAAAPQGQQRKRNPSPYILHPMEAAVICGTISSDPEILAAAMLHDTVEDSGVRFEELEARFGPRVAALVASETENKRPELPPAETWRLRKEESLETLAQARDPGVKILWLGDKLANLRSIYPDWRKRGDEVWKAFNQKDPTQQAWYYRRIRDLLRSLRNTTAWQELDFYVREIFAEVP